MPIGDADWVRQYNEEHPSDPLRNYDDYREAVRVGEIHRDYPNVSYQQIYAQDHNRPYGSNAVTGDGGGSPAAAPVYKPVANWSDWLDVYGSQTGKVEDMPDELKAMQSGQGASALWDKFIPTAMPNATDTQRQRLGLRFNSEFNKFVQDSQLRAQQGADPIGWHNWLTTKGPEGLAKDFAYMAPQDRGETPWMFNERQRVQYR